MKVGYSEVCLQLHAELVQAVLPHLFNLIDGAVLLLTLPQEHFTCSVLIEARPPSRGSES